MTRTPLASPHRSCVQFPGRARASPRRPWQTCGLSAVLHERANPRFRSSRAAVLGAAARSQFPRHVELTCTCVCLTRVCSKLVHAAVAPDPQSGAILTPIFQSTTYIQESIEQYLERGYSYSRTNNPTVTTLEEKIAILEGGHGAACFGTGMAATIAVVSGMMNAGDHCVITNCSYGGTNRACRTMFTDMGMTFDFIDFTDIDNIAAHIKPNTKLIFSESPANPTLTLTDIAAVSSLAKSKGIPHVVDSTFATPVIQRPIELGADLVIQSTTKFYDGHNMTVGGAVICATQELHERIKHMQNVHGNIMSPQNAFYTLQTTKTLGLRIARQSATAQKVAEFLEKHPAVDVVRYPGLASHPQKELADRQHMNGLHGGMEPVREPRRDRVHLHLPIGDDACEHAHGGPPQGWHHRWVCAHFVRSRGSRRPDRGAQELP
jgi:cystathionine gamma-lyase